MTKETEQEIYELYTKIVKNDIRSPGMVDLLADFLESGACTMRDLRHVERKTRMGIIPPISARVEQELFYRKHPEERGKRDLE